MNDAELFNLFVGGQATTAEIAVLSLPDMGRQIAELRQDEPDDIAMTDAEIGNAIHRYAVADSA